MTGEENWKADDLSRSISIQKGKIIEEIMKAIGLGEEEIMKAIGFGDKPVIAISGDPAAKRLIEACRPGVGVGSELEFITLWEEIRSASSDLGKE